jgi:hypothetical protein
MWKAPSARSWRQIPVEAEERAAARPGSGKSLQRRDKVFETGRPRNMERFPADFMFELTEDEL